MTPVYPLSAIVGHDELVDALLVNAVAPDVGGVLVRGERGTAKSTAVRGLAPLLPPVLAARDQPFAFGPGELAPGGRVPSGAATELRPAPLVELPLGATLDRLVGALDLRLALAGERAFEAGLLARAHHGILYVDEVNLLPDHLVDALLDAASSGVARVEREAVSVVHDARFLLVGTMNVEEGELRPQLLDRFGLGVEVRAPREPGLRAEIVRRRRAFERDPEAFADAWRESDEALRERIAGARKRLDVVRLPERELLRIAGACARLGVDGVRGDIVSARAAQALAALAGADEVDAEHVRRAAALALAHRRRPDPLDGSGPDDGELERALAEEPGEEPPGGGPPRDGDRHSEPADTARATEAGASAAAASTAGPTDPSALARRRLDPPAPAGLPRDALALAARGAGPTGRRARGRGREAGAIDSRPAAPGSDDLAIVATLRAGLAGAEPDRARGALDGAEPDGARGAPAAGAPVRAPGSLAGATPAHLREHVRAGREGVLICLVVDASGSMGARRRLARVKGALLALLRDAYARRDRVAVVAFREAAADLLVPAGAPLERAAAAIRQLPTGGRTPLAAGLDTAERLIRHEAARSPERRSLAVVLTDGRAADPEQRVRAAALRLGRAADAVHVVDTEDGPARLGMAAALAAAAGGQVHALAPNRAAGS